MGKIKLNMFKSLKGYCIEKINTITLHLLLTIIINYYANRYKSDLKLSS